MWDLDMHTIYMASLFVEGVLYGVFITTALLQFYAIFIPSTGMYIICFCISSIVLYRRDRKSKGLYCVFVVSVLMFLTGTAHMAVNSYRLLSGYVLRVRDPITGELVLTIAEASFIIKNATYTVQTLLGDGFLLYRLYVTWSGSRVVCLPLLICFLACTAVGIQMLNSQAVASTGDIFTPTMGWWLIAFFSITLFTDLTCSLLIGGRIWWIHRRMQKSVPSTHLMRTAIIIVESGVIYSICLALLLGLYLAGTVAHKIVLDGVTQLIGIVFSVIIIRLGFGLSTGDATNTMRLDTVLFTQDQNISRITTQDEQFLPSAGESTSSSMPTKVDENTDTRLSLRYLDHSKA